MLQNGLWSEGGGGNFSRPWGQWTGGPVNWTTVRVTGSPGEEVSQRGWADGVWSESVPRQVDACHPHFATASKQVASPSSSSLQGSPSHGTASPRVPSHHIYTVCTHTYADTQIHTHIHTHQWFSSRATLSQPRHLGTGRVNSRSQG